MINLKVRTEYSFRHSYGKIKDVISSQGEYAAITDRFNTFGHIPFWNECKRQGKKAILGVELAFVENATLKVRETPYFVTLIAKNAVGLSEIYKLVSKSTKQKYYFNRLAFSELESLSDNIIVIIEDAFLEKYIENKKDKFYGVSPITPLDDVNKSRSELIAISDNLYDKQKNRKLYEIILGNGKFEARTELSHILNKEEWWQEVSVLDGASKIVAIQNSIEIVQKIEDFDFIQAELPKTEEKKSLWELCCEGAEKRNQIGVDGVFQTEKYIRRLERELKLIEEKNFQNYFYLVYDLVEYAKKHMLVGPARGSSAGSLTCYWLGITDVDPIKHDLIFERFIDINRNDMPDIDIDFQDTKREMLLGYLQDKYGHDCVAKLGTVSKYKPRSILTEIAKVLDIPQWKIKDLKDSIEETNSGKDLEDSFNNSQIAKDYLKKYPKLVISKNIEGHSRHYGQHAAGIVVADKSLDNYCSLDYAVDGCQLDKNDAETVNLLKIDCLGLRTLTVIQDCLDLIGKDRNWIVDYPLDDDKAFDIINSGKFYGISQFEGNALIRVSKKINIKSFSDISAITALARPGPLMSGGTEKYIKSNNSETINYQHPLLEPFLKETFGVLVYQEQMMQIVREIGGFSWAETSKMRKSVSKKQGDDFIVNMSAKFVKNAVGLGIDKEVSQKIWKDIIAMGSYAFNKSHAVAYAMLSYWCMVLKTYHPLEFALATLKNAKDSDQVIQMLKELVNEGYEYKTFHRELSEVDWSIKEGKLIGGFTNIKGVGKVKAANLVEKIKNNKNLTVAEKKALFNAETPFDKIFEFKEDFQDFYDNWGLFLNSQPRFIKDIDEEADVRFLCRLSKISLRDINDAKMLKKRNGEVIDTGCLKFLDLEMQDDTDSISGRIVRELYEKTGKEIFDNHKDGDHYLIYGKALSFRYVMIKNIKKITVEDIKNKINEKSC